MTERDHSKGRANPASAAAFAKGNRGHQSARDRIYALICESPEGLTAKEIGIRLGWAIHTYSGRLTSLKMAGLIRGTGERKYGSEVLVAVRAPQQLGIFESEAS
jgi:hypothetical protein